MAKFPLLFSASVVFGDVPRKGSQGKINNATATLINLNSRLIAITCHHVLDEYRNILRDGKKVFQINMCAFNPIERIIHESPKYDIVLIDLGGLDISEIINSEEISSKFFVPSKWPPSDIKDDDFVAFGGFPGKWREFISFDEIIFGTFSSGACRIASVGDNYFVCQFEREYWVESMKSMGYRATNLHDIGGLSGGPVFILRELYFELIGIIYQFSIDYELMYVRSTRIIQNDGTIID